MRKFGDVISITGKIRNEKFHLTVMEREDSDYCQGVLVIGDRGFYFSDYRLLAGGPPSYGCGDILHGFLSYVNADTRAGKANILRQLKFYTWCVLSHFRRDFHDVEMKELKLNMGSLSSTWDIVYDVDEDQQLSHGISFQSVKQGFSNLMTSVKKYLQK